jgi:hypothetical protein
MEPTAVLLGRVRLLLAVKSEGVRGKSTSTSPCARRCASIARSYTPCPDACAWTCVSCPANPTPTPTPTPYAYPMADCNPQPSPW